MRGRTWTSKHIAISGCSKRSKRTRASPSEVWRPSSASRSGLTNIYLKRLVRKGYIKCVNVQSNRITYLITPRGIAEKARLTYEFMDYSLHLYGEVRQHLRVGAAASAPPPAGGWRSSDAAKRRSSRICR